MPESLAKQKKRIEGWEAEREVEAKAKATAAEKKKEDIYQRAEKHLAEYKAQVSESMWK